MKPNPITKRVLATFERRGLPAVAEHRFCAGRRWRFDYAWPAQRVALEVQGGTWSGGRHTRPLALRREWEKLNCAAALGWRVLFCSPQQVTSRQLMEQLTAAINFSHRDTETQR